MANLFVILAEGAGAQHVEPSVFGLTATAWVSIAMLILIGIVLWKKVPALIGAALDKKIAEIRQHLDDAKSLRTDAEKLRAEYESKLATAASEIEDMKSRAEQEAEDIVAQAKANATQLVSRRKAMAEQKIAAAERAAVQEIKAKVANAATSAAAVVIAAKHDKDADGALVDGTIADLGNRLN